MAVYGWDVVVGDVQIPATGTTNMSSVFTVPRGAFSVAIHVPTLQGSTPTLLIQSLEPNDDKATEVWRPTNVFDLTTGTSVALDEIGHAKVTTLPVTAIGGGVHRFQASTDQSSGPSTVKVVFMISR
jgi:hypothetical protein